MSSEQNQDSIQNILNDELYKNHTVESMYSFDTKSPIVSSEFIFIQETVVANDVNGNRLGEYYCVLRSSGLTERQLYLRQYALQIAEYKLRVEGTFNYGQDNSSGLIAYPQFEELFEDDHPVIKEYDQYSDFHFIKPDGINFDQFKSNILNMVVRANEELVNFGEPVIRSTPQLVSNLQEEGSPNPQITDWKPIRENDIDTRVNFNLPFRKDGSLYSEIKAPNNILAIYAGLSYLAYNELYVEHFFKRRKFST